MEVRRKELEEPFGVTPARMFEVLTTPSAIRSWWGASKAIVDLKEGGTWITAWGEGEESSDHVTSYKITQLDPPNRFILGSSKYITVGSTLETNITTEFRVEPHPHGCNLRIVQVMDPADPLFDDYFDACAVGWENCYEGIRHFLHNNPETVPANTLDEPAEQRVEDVSTSTTFVEADIDRDLTPEEEFKVSKLTAKDLKAIDAALVGEASTSERTVAWVVGKTMEALGTKFDAIPSSFFARRVRKLIGEGKLETEGDPGYVRRSEVRRKRKSK